ncbi:MAG: Fic family protein [Candidatus Omnitrophota bacterium]
MKKKGANTPAKIKAGFNEMLNDKSTGSGIVCAAIENAVYGIATVDTIAAMTPYRPGRVAAILAGCDIDAENASRRTNGGKALIILPRDVAPDAAVRAIDKAVSMGNEITAEDLEQAMGMPMERIFGAGAGNEFFALVSHNLRLAGRLGKEEELIIKDRDTVNREAREEKELCGALARLGHDKDGAVVSVKELAAALSWQAGDVERVAARIDFGSLAIDPFGDEDFVRDQDRIISELDKLAGISTLPELISLVRMEKHKFYRTIKRINWKKINMFRAAKGKYSLEYDALAYFEGKPIKGIRNYPAFIWALKARGAWREICRAAFRAYRKKLGRNGMSGFSESVILPLAVIFESQGIRSGSDEEKTASYNLKRVLDICMECGVTLNGRADLTRLFRLAAARAIRRAHNLWRKAATDNIVTEFAGLLVDAAKEAVSVPDGWPNGSISIDDETRKKITGAENTLFTSALERRQTAKNGAVVGSEELASVLGWTEGKVNEVNAMIDFTEWNNTREDGGLFAIDPAGDNEFVRRQDMVIRIIEDLAGVATFKEIKAKTGLKDSALRLLLSRINWVKINKERSRCGKYSLEPFADKVFEGNRVTHNSVTKAGLRRRIRIREAWMSICESAVDSYQEANGYEGLRAFTGSVLPVLCGIASDIEARLSTHPNSPGEYMIGNNMGQVLTTVIKCASGLKGHADLDRFNKLVVLRAFRWSGDLFDDMADKDINGYFAPVLVHAVKTTLPVSGDWLARTADIERELRQTEEDTFVISGCFQGDQWLKLCGRLDAIRARAGFCGMWENLPKAVMRIINRRFNGQSDIVRKYYLLYASGAVIKESKALINERKFNRVAYINDDYDRALMAARISLDRGIEAERAELLEMPSSSKQFFDLRFRHLGLTMGLDDPYPESTGDIDNVLLGRILGIEDAAMLTIGYHVSRYIHEVTNEYERKRLEGVIEEYGRLMRIARESIKTEFSLILQPRGKMAFRRVAYLWDLKVKMPFMMDLFRMVMRQLPDYEITKLSQFRNEQVRNLVDTVLDCLGLKSVTGKTGADAKDARAAGSGKGVPGIIRGLLKPWHIGLGFLAGGFAVYMACGMPVFASAAGVAGTVISWLWHERAGHVRAAGALLKGLGFEEDEVAKLVRWNRFYTRVWMDWDASGLGAACAAKIAEIGRTGRDEVDAGMVRAGPVASLILALFMIAALGIAILFSNYAPFPVTFIVKGISLPTLINSLTYFVIADRGRPVKIMRRDELPSRQAEPPRSGAAAEPDAPTAAVPRAEPDGGKGQESMAEKSATAYAKIYVKLQLRNDYSIIRHPNVVAGDMLELSRTSHIDAEMILDKLMELVNLEKFAYVYKNAIMLNRGNRFWNLIDTSGVEWELAVLARLGERPFIDPERVRMSPGGNHVLSDFEEAEVPDFKEAIGVVNDLVRAGRPFDEAAFKRVHAVMSRHLLAPGKGRTREGMLVNAGQYRHSDVHRSYLTFPYSSKVEEVMSRLFEFMEREEFKELHPVEQAAIAFYMVFHIQPFENGNTRMASLLANYILMKNNYEPFYLTAENEGKFHEMFMFMSVPEGMTQLGGGWFTRTPEKMFGIEYGLNSMRQYAKQFTAFLAGELAKGRRAGAPGPAADGERPERVPVREIIAAQLARKMDMCESELSRCSGLFAGSGQKTLILYADGILENAVLYDFRETLEKLTREGGVLRNGKIVLYVKDEQYEDMALDLKRAILRIAGTMDVIVVRARDISENPGDLANPTREVDALLSTVLSANETCHQRAFVDSQITHGAKVIKPGDVLAIIRGNGLDWMNACPEYNVYMREKGYAIPMVVLNGHENNIRGIFSFAEAMWRAFQLTGDRGQRTWLDYVSCIDNTEHLYETYLSERRHLLTQL